jgi:hypothetical protein
VLPSEWRDAWDQAKPWVPWLLWHWKTFLLNITAIMCINWTEAICTQSPTSRANYSMGTFLTIKVKGSLQSPTLIPRNCQVSLLSDAYS